jgi:tetratricopeptide (TPR) repeat protein
MSMERIGQVMHSDPVRRLFESAADLPPERRAAHLDQAASDDPALRRQVEVLLAIDERARALEASAPRDDASASRWERLASALIPAAHRTPRQQAAFLDEFGGDDAALRSHLASLFGFEEHAERLVRARPLVGQDRDAMLGSRISHYEVVEKLGAGGMGVVYRARDIRLDRMVALKFLPAHMHESEAARDRFSHEARAASALDHPNVGTVHEIDETDDGRLFIAMACYGGETLREKLDRGPVPVTEALDYAIQMAAGLARAHGAGIVHRDLKPANVMVTEEGVVKLLDFGLAKMRDVQLTQTGSQLGTAAYMSPEQIRGEAVDPAADIWALGVVMYEMLAGVRPFRGDYGHAVFYAVLHSEPAPLSELRKDLPDGLDGIVRKCLQKPSADRYADARQVLAELRSVERGGAGSSDRPAPPAARRALPVAFIRPWMRAGLLVVAIALLIPVIGWLVGHRGPTVQHLAVLPFRVIGSSAESDALSAGLLETLTSKLTQLEAYQGTLRVLPASEISAPLSAGDARARFGVSMVVTGSVQVDADQVRLTLNLVDARTQRQLGSRQIDHRRSNALALQDEAVLMLARMLQVELSPPARQALAAGGTAQPLANELYLQGRGHLRNHQSLAELDLAIESFRKATEEDAQFALAFAGLGEAYWQKYRLTSDVRWADMAAEQSHRAVDLSDGLAPVYVTLAIIHSGSGRHDDALRSLAQAIELDPTSSEAYRQRALVFRRLGRNEEAEASYRNAITLSPEYWRGYNGLGVFYYLSGRYEEAIEQYQRGLSLAPANNTLLLNLGATYWQIERLDEATGMFERVIEIDPANTSARLNLATAYFYKSRFADAARLYREELALRPHDHAVHGYLADALSWLPEERDQAAAAYRRAIAIVLEQLRIREQDPELLGSLAGYHARLGEADSALNYLQPLAAQNPPDQTDVVQAFGIGEVYEALGERELALLWMTSALERGYGWIQIRNSPWLQTLRMDPIVQNRLRDIDTTP